MKILTIDLDFFVPKRWNTLSRLFDDGFCWSSTLILRFTALDIFFVMAETVQSYLLHPKFKEISDFPLNLPVFAQFGCDCSELLSAVLISICVCVYGIKCQFSKNFLNIN